MHPIRSMTLPYPYEVETGELKPRGRFKRPVFDVERHMREEIQSTAEGAELFGVQFPLPEPGGELQLEHWRAVLTAHFNERIATPDAATWHEFAAQARAQLERHARLDEDVLPMLRATIDGL